MDKLHWRFLFAHRASEWITANVPNGPQTKGEFMLRPGRIFRHGEPPWRQIYTVSLLHFPLLRKVNERYQPRGKPRTPSSAASGGVLNPKGNKYLRYLNKKTSN